MTKKYLVLTACMVTLSLTKVLAQQDPYYSFFMFNKMVYNPAYAGSKDYICATALYKEQWSGLPDAPVFQTVSINSPMGRKMGIGLSVVNDKIGFATYLNPMLSLSYKFQVGGSGVLAAGASGGFMQGTLDGTKLKAVNPNDPKIPKGNVSGMTPDINAGIYYTNASIYNLYVGASATHLMQGKIDYAAGLSSYNLATHYYLVGGVEIPAGSIVLEPNIMVKKDPAKWQIDFNAFALINNKIRGGLSLHSGDALIGMLGYQFTRNLHAGYCYDFTTSKIQKYSAGSHEFYITYCFKFGTPPPKPTNIKLTPRYL